MLRVSQMRSNHQYLATITEVSHLSEFSPMLTALLNTHMLFFEYHHAQFLFSFLRSIKKSVFSNESYALTWWNGLHDFLCLLLVVNLKSEKVLWSSKLELGDIALLVLLDGDSVSLWKMLLLSSHDLDEVLQVLDFLWL